MYKLTFTLTQHSPIIHFQHDQRGATLRATEVKPKLDRFLIEKLPLTETVDNRTVPKKEFEDWFNNKEKLSLDYKLRIDGSEALREYDVTIIPPNREKAIIRDGEFGLYITSFHDELLKRITEPVIKEFFILHNFGKRQSKGFGGFYIKGTNAESFSSLNKAVYKYRYNQDSGNNGVEFYKIITKAWRELKSGSNIPYKKSRMFRYLFSKGYRWDKRWFKVRLFKLINDPNNTNPEFRHRLSYTRRQPLDVSRYENRETSEGLYSYNDNREVPYKDYKYRFGRACLGLAEHYEFRTERRDRIYQLKVKSEDIGRFKSPVTFKVFGRSIFAIAETIPDELKDARFDFDLIVKGSSRNELLRNFTDLTTPENFDLVDFLDNNFRIVGFDRIEQ